ncbi:UDP-N-acetylglucosamine 2-epimerase [Candidatus Methanobinarius endosymbioticus]|uniref:UDP-N-acetylglucosamine 2-epimerase n=1 Tax=Candidatus Methanobinarius endosymbioticus TaxID=2006182 RepID=A0A366MDV0_9EURY|nr:UDP-N-acetylglucosamine 2-epimerase [Candidatus Methanobinarius endosymbioticus]
MKIAIVLGTRPEIIKMVSIIEEINSRGDELLLIHTGQHYDHEMSDQFFEELELPAPNYNIGVGSGSHGKQTGKMMEKIEEVLIKEHPDIVLVQGDTNAVLAGALVASKLYIPVGHVEAGLRSYDITMPEEINRKAADVCSKYYFVPTEKSAINLSIEGIPRKNIFIAGNTVVDACFRNLKIAKKRFEDNEHEKSSKLSELLQLDNILTLTMHRAENVDNKERLMNIISALTELKDLNIVFPIHPRTKKTMEEFGLYDKLANLDHMHLIKPLGYLDFLLLMSKSLIILTDSGGLQEEAITLNIPALTLRYNTERPETVTMGGNILVGANKDLIIETANKILNDTDFYNKMSLAKNPYGDGSSGKQIVDIIEKSYEKGDCILKSPDDIMDVFTTLMSEIDEDITVFDFEKKNNTILRTVFSKKDNSMKFPENNLNLNGMQILYDKFS